MFHVYYRGYRQVDRIIQQFVTFAEDNYLFNKPTHADGHSFVSNVEVAREFYENPNFEPNLMYKAKKKLPKGRPWTISKSHDCPSYVTYQIIFDPIIPRTMFPENEITKHKTSCCLL